MKKDNDLQPLIEAYFDETISEEQRAELERALIHDPEAARRFVRAARLDNALRLHFNRRAAEAAAVAALKRAGLDPTPQAVSIPRWARTVDHLWGPLGAVLAHAALILLLVRWVVLPVFTSSPSPPVEVEVGREERMRLDPFQIHDHPSLSRGADTMPPPLNAPEFAVMPPDPHALSVPRASPPNVVIRDGRLWSEPIWMRNRTESHRSALLARYAPEWADRTEPALDAALEWLRRARHAEGGWSEDPHASRDPALTALATLAFLARGEPLTSIQSDISALVDSQEPGGGWRSLENGADALGIGACALIEAWARVPLPPLRRAAELAVERLIQEQDTAGLWPGADPWALSWRVLALRMAVWANLDVHGGRAGLSRLAGGLKTIEDPAGGLYEGERPSSKAIERLAVVALALQWLGEERSPEARKTLATLSRVRMNDPLNPFIRHVLAQIRFNAGGDHWIKERGVLADILLAGRESDGGWRRESSALDGRVRTTSLAVLTLTVCYRYPPAAEWPAWPVAGARPPAFTHGPILAALRLGPVP